MAFLNKEGVERLWLHIVSKLNKKVDKIEGKGLSTNDYTTEEKEQLATLVGNLSEVLPVANGGTGATTAIAARENLLMIVSEIEPAEPVEGTLWFDIS